MLWGDGAAAADTNLYRSAADVLKTDDALSIGGAVGFYGTAPAGKPTVTGSRVVTPPWRRCSPPWRRWA